MKSASRTRHNRLQATPVVPTPLPVLVARHPGLRALEAVLRDLTKALKETDPERKGGFPNRMTLYGLDLVQARRACGGKLDITPLAFPYGAFRIGDADGLARHTGVENAALNTAAVAAKMG
jgi:hypothetical protein